MLLPRTDSFLSGLPNFTVFISWNQPKSSLQSPLIRVQGNSGQIGKLSPEQRKLLLSEGTANCVPLFAADKDLHSAISAKLLELDSMHIHIHVNFNLRILVLQKLD